MLFIYLQFLHTSSGEW